MSIKRIFFGYKHKNVLVSVNMWKLENPNVIFYYQNDDATRGVPFTIGIQTSWQKIPRLYNTYRTFFCHAGFCKICTATLQYMPHFLLPHWLKHHIDILIPKSWLVHTFQGSL